MQDKTTIKFLPWFGIPKLWPYFRAYKKDMIIMFVTGAISTLSEIIFPLFNQFAINNFIGKKELNGLGRFIVLYLIGVGFGLCSLKHRNKRCKRPQKFKL